MTRRRARTAPTRRLLGIGLGCAMLVAGCGYIVTPADETSPSPATGSGSWTAVPTKVESAGDALKVDITIRNDTGAWSSMQAIDGQAATLTGGGSTTDCAVVSVGTGGTSLAPGFQVRGYTGGSAEKPTTKLLSVECAGAAPAPGQKLSIAYSYVTGDFNYYAPTAPTSATLEVDLDKVATDLTYPIATEIGGVVEPADTKIDAINHCTLVLVSADRTADGMTFGWKTDNPTEYQTYVHIGNPPVVGADGVIYGFYESPHLADTPITPAGQSATWSTSVAVPKDVTGLYLLVSVESKQQKTFVSHALDITDK